MVDKKYIIGVIKKICIYYVEIGGGINSCELIPILGCIIEPRILDY